jgi:hypothetical protein
MNLLKHLFILVFALFFLSNASAQQYSFDRLSENSVYAEVSYAGKIMAGTLNYERYLGNSNYITYYADIAAGYWKIGEGNASIKDGVVVIKDNDGFMLPIGIHGVLFSSLSHLELGFGINITYENLLNGISVYPIVNIGYRYQPIKGGLTFRVNGYLAQAFFPGISLGYSF